MRNDKMILQSNCSEQCMRLTGSLKEIKTEVLKMLDIWKNETNEEDGISDTEQNELTKLRERIKNIKELKEFEILKFDFTTNYETYFKEKDGDILVATCNNHEWGDLNSEFMDSEEYWNIRDGSRYHIVFEDDRYILAQKQKDEDAIREIIADKILINKKTEIRLEIENEYGDNKKKTFRMFEKNGEHFTRDDKLNKIIKVDEVKDEQIIQQIETLIELRNNGKKK